MMIIDHNLVPRAFPLQVTKYSYQSYFHRILFFLGNTDFVPTLWTSKGPPCHKRGGGGVFN